MKHILVPLIGLVFATISVSCGGGDDDDSSGPTGGASCSVTAACGGDIAGDWTITGFCPDTSVVPAKIKELCEVATLDYDQPTVSGTLSFKASDMTFAQSTTAKGTGYLVLPADCLKQDSLTCDQAQQLINSSSGASPVQCTASNGGCKCALSVDESPTASGTYSTSGNTLTLKANDTLESPYCVKDGELSLTLAFTPGDKMYQFGGQLKLKKK